MTQAASAAALVFSFAQESAALFPNARFEGVPDDPRLVVGKAPSGGGLRLVYGADDTQHVQARTHLANLSRNLWVEVVRGRTTIRPGERMRKL